MNCSLNGYGNVNTFKDLTEEDIDNIEEYSQTKLIRLLEKSAIDSGNELDENIKKAFFGIYAVSPEEFQFVRGDRKLISKIVDRVKEKIQTDGEYFTPKLPRKRQKLPFTGISESLLGLIYGDFTEHFKTTNISINDLKEKLFHSAKSVFDSFETEIVNRNSHCSTSLTIDMISVSHGEKIQGTVKCIICQKQNAKVSLKQNPRTGSSNWIMCNLKSHIQNCLKLPKKEKQTLVKNFVDPNDNGLMNDDLENAHSNDINFTIDSDGSCLHDTNNESFISNKNNTIVNLNITPISEIEDNDLQDQYEELVTSQILIQNIKISNAVFQSKDVELTINSGFGTTSRPFQFNICDVPADGNCLFSSIAHQIMQVKINSAEHVNHTHELRKSVINYIEENIIKYLHCLRGRLLDSGECDKNATTEDCLAFVKNRLAVAGTFGGTESIQAISCIYKTNVIVLSEEGTAYFGALFNCTYKKSIMIAFRGTKSQNNQNRNHYGSVTNIKQPFVSQVSKHLIQNHMKSVRNGKHNTTVTVE